MNLWARIKKHYSYVISLGLHSAVFLFLLVTPMRHFGGEGWGPPILLGGLTPEQANQIASNPEEVPTPKKEKTKKPKVTDGKDYVQPMRDEIPPTPTPEPTDKPSPTPKPTNTPKPTATEKPTKTPTPEVKPTETEKPTPKPTKTPKPKETPTEKPKEKPTATPTKVAKPSPIPTLEPFTPPVAVVPVDKLPTETSSAVPAPPDSSIPRVGNEAGSPRGVPNGPLILGDPGMDYGIYAGILNKILDNNWRPPKVRPAVMKQYTAVMAFTINPDGSISDIRFNMNSGWPALDMSIQDAVNRSAPLTQLSGVLSSGPVKVLVPFRFTPK